MKIILLKLNNVLFIETLIIYLLKNSLANRVLLVNNIKFFLTFKNKAFFLNGYIILIHKN